MDSGYFTFVAFDLSFFFDLGFLTTLHWKGKSRIFGASCLTYCLNQSYQLLESCLSNLFVACQVVANFLRVLEFGVEMIVSDMINIASESIYIL
jgi:hypothetical protein